MLRQRDFISTGPLPANANATDRLSDAHGRLFDYLRLSVTDVCNFRCGYCLPDGYHKPAAQPQFLSVDEITRLVRGFSALGLWKVRLTGGEPTVRRDFAAIARAVTSVSGIRAVAMTTNGHRLAANAAAYYDAGVRAINISIDSLDPAIFHRVTGHDRLNEVLAGVDACQAAGFDAVKINVVLMRGVNDTAAALDQFIAMVRDRPITVRFIEVMRTNDQPAFWAKHYVPAAHIGESLMQRGWHAAPRANGAGPSVDHTRPGITGRIGVIAPYGDGFCATCNRLRVSATGRLHLCLFGDGGVDIRPHLQSDDQQAALIMAVRDAVRGKTAGHALLAGNSGATPHFASIGG